MPDMKVLIVVLMAAVSVSVAKPGHTSEGYGSYDILPQPVQDTYEVAAAKAEHFAAHAKALAATAHAAPDPHGVPVPIHGHGTPATGYSYSTVHTGYGANYHSGTGYHNAAHVVLTAHGVPVDSPEVQAAQAANAAAHLAAKHQHLHG